LDHAGRPHYPAELGQSAASRLAAHQPATHQPAAPPASVQTSSVRRCGTAAGKWSWPPLIRAAGTPAIPIIPAPRSAPVTAAQRAASKTIRRDAYRTTAPGGFPVWLAGSVTADR